MDDLTEKRRNQIKQLWQETKERAAQQLAEENNFLYTNLHQENIQTSALGLVKEEEAKKAKLAVFFRQGQNLKVAVADPLDPLAVKTIEQLKQKGFKVTIFVVTIESLRWAWHNYRFIYNRTSRLSNLLDISNTPAIDFPGLNDALKDIPPTEVTSLFSLIIKSAVLASATDIHLEPQEQEALIRFRIDGLLQDVAEISLNKYQALSQRIKLISGMKINLANISQGGRFSVINKGENVDIRTATLPSPKGEFFVLRLLPEEKASWGLTDLGMRNSDINLLTKYLSATNGMILVTGPTGSGKTTTLYTLLKQKISPGIKIITIEDPIEYRIPGISQTQVTPEYTFANGLKSILRQDPDVIMIGEMRDKETVKTAMQAALTGHLVLSTLHTNEASGTIARLQELGADPDLIPNAVRIIIAQRLVRRLCPICKEKYVPSPELKKKLIETFSILSPKSKIKIPKDIPYLWKAQGCPKCHWLGYKGQIGIFEQLPITSRISKAIEQGADQDHIRNIAIDEGMVPLFHDGLIKAIEGITSLEEVNRVAGDVSYIQESYKELFSQVLTRGIVITPAQDKEIHQIIQSPHSLANALKSKTISQKLAYLIGVAIRSRATDIHFEPEEEVSQIRERIDGVLHPLFTIEKNEYPALMNELKAVSGLNTEENQMIQEGRFQVKFPEKNFAIRVSIIPGGYGEAAALRVLGGEVKALDLEKLGLNEWDEKKIEKIIHRTEGLIIVSGPTSAGKTTTLFAILKKIATPDLKIITVEDPIEYRLPGIVQTQVDPQKGYTFAKALPSLLRQNPNVLVIGEIRDKETARLAWQASLTGHLVLTTIHANNTKEVFTRLESLGINTKEILPSINLIIAQRLVRKLCPSCKKEIEAPKDLDKLIRQTLGRVPEIKHKYHPPYHIYQEVGCPRCNFTGYLGRLGIFEILIPGDKIRTLADIQKMRYPQLIDDAVVKLLAGQTSRDEIKRVLGV